MYVINTQIEKVSQRNNKGESTGCVYTLQTDFLANGKKAYFFVLQQGEHGEVYFMKHYKRLPSKVRNLFI